LIIPREKFRFNRLEGLISYPLFIFNSKNVEKEKTITKNVSLNLCLMTCPYVYVHHLKNGGKRSKAGKSLAYTSHGVKT